MFRLNCLVSMFHISNKTIRSGSGVHLFPNVQTEIKLKKSSTLKETCTFIFQYPITSGIVYMQVLQYTPIANVKSCSVLPGTEKKCPMHMT